MLDNQFFTQYQKQLVWLANTRFGQWLFKHGEVEKLIKITPNSVSYRSGREVTTVFRTHAKYSKRLAWLLHFLPIEFFQVSPNASWGLRPLVGFTTTDTFYPDANPEVSSVDGDAGRDITGSPVSWSTIRSGSGTQSSDSGTSATVSFFEEGGPNLWKILTRGIILWDTSSIDDNVTINTVVLSLWPTASNNQHSPNVAICSSAPASNTALVNADFNIANFGSVTFASIGLGGITLNQYNDFTLDSNGRANVTKTGVSKFGVRMSQDIDNSTPGFVSGTANSSITYRTADQTGTSNDPKLAVTHTDIFTTTISDTMGSVDQQHTAQRQAIATISDSMGSSDAPTAQRQAIATILDTMGSTDIPSAEQTWERESKNTTTWTRQGRS